MIEGLEGRVLMAVQLVSAPVGAEPTNAPGNASGDQPEISEDGRWAVFASNASNLVAGVNDASGNTDVFLRDLQSGTTTMISQTDNTSRGGQFPSISSDGRYIAFNTTSGVFAQGGAVDSNGANDVYVYDRTANTYTLASAVNGGTLAVGNALRASISSNGRVVAFVSAALSSTVVPGTTDTNSTQRDVFVRNLDTNVTTLASSIPGGAASGNGRSDDPEISGDGNFVVFHSQASDLTAIEDVNGADDVFRRAIAGTGADLVSVGTGPTAAGGASPSVNGDGNLVAFESGATNLVAGDTNAVIDVFVRDMTAGAFSVASTNASGNLANSNSLNPSLSANGQFVAFQSSATNLVAPDAGNTDVYLKNRVDGTVTRVSQNEAGEQAAGNSTLASVDADGNAVAFISTATNLAVSNEPPPETDEDIFAMTSGTTPPVDTTPPTVSIAALPITGGGALTHTITVTYNDTTAVDVSSIDIADVTVLQTSTGVNLTVLSVVVTPNTNNATVTAQYNVTAPGGAWDTPDNGTYAISVNAGQVRDTANNLNAVATGSFTVNIPGGGPGGPGPDLLGAFAPRPVLPPAVIGGQRGKARLILTNEGDAPAQGPLSVQLVASTDNVFDPGDITFDTITRPVRINAGRTRAFPIRFTYPNVADDQYFLFANVDSTNAVQESDEGNNIAASAAPVTIAQPFVDLTATVGAPPRGAFTLGRRTNVPITVTNSGNVPATGLLQIDVYASPDAARGADDLPLATISRQVRIRHGRSRILRVPFLFPSTIPAGSYFVTTTIDSTNSIVESDDNNNDAVSAAPFAVA